MMNQGLEGNLSDNPQQSRVMSVGNLGLQAEFAEIFSSFETGLRLNGLFVKCLRKTDGRQLTADERTTLVTLARNASTHIRRADAFLDRSSELVQLAERMGGSGIEKAYAWLLASDQYSPLFKKRLREYVDKSGGIQSFVMGSTSRAQIALDVAYGRLQRALQKLEQGQRPNREAFDRTRLPTAEALPTAETEGGDGGTSGGGSGTGDAGPSDDSLYEGGIAAVGIGLGAIAAAGTIVASPLIATGLIFAGGFMIGWGAGSVILAFVDGFPVFLTE